MKETLYKIVEWRQTSEWFNYDPKVTQLNRYDGPKLVKGHSNNAYTAFQRFLNDVQTGLRQLNGVVTVVRRYSNGV